MELNTFVWKLLLQRTQNIAGSYGITFESFLHSVLHALPVIALQASSCSISLHTSNDKEFTSFKIEVDFE